MNSNIDVQQVKEYNNKLKEYREKANRLSTELEVHEANLKEQCEKLGSELGIQITSDNIESLIEQYVNKVNNTMQVGNEILNRINTQQTLQAEESVGFTAPVQSVPVTPVQSVPVTPVQSVPPVNLGGMGNVYTQVPGDYGQANTENVNPGSFIKSVQDSQSFVNNGILNI